MPYCVSENELDLSRHIVVGGPWPGGCLDCTTSSSTVSSSSSYFRDCACAAWPGLATATTDGQGAPVLQFSNVDYTPCVLPEHAFLIQARAPGGQWLFLAPNDLSGYTGAFGISPNGMASAPYVYGQLGTITYDGTDFATGEPTTRADIRGYRWNFVSSIQTGVNYETRGTAYLDFQDILATLCPTDPASSSSSSALITSSSSFVSSSALSSSSSNSSSVAPSSQSSSSDSSRPVYFTWCDVPTCAQDSTTCWIGCTPYDSSSSGSCDCVPVNDVGAFYKYTEECSFFTHNDACTNLALDAAIELFAGEYYRVSFAGSLGAYDKVTPGPDGATGWPLDIGTPVGLRFVGKLGSVDIPLSSLTTPPAGTPVESLVTHIPGSQFDYPGAKYQYQLRAAITAAPTDVRVFYFTRQWLNDTITPLCDPADFANAAENELPMLVDALITYSGGSQACAVPLTCAFLPDPYIPAITLLSGNKNTLTSSSSSSNSSESSSDAASNCDAARTIYDNFDLSVGYYPKGSVEPTCIKTLQQFVYISWWSTEALPDYRTESRYIAGGEFGRATTYDSRAVFDIFALLKRGRLTLAGLGACEEGKYFRTEIAAANHANNQTFDQSTPVINMQLALNAGAGGGVAATFTDYAVTYACHLSADAFIESVDDARCQVGLRTVAVISPPSPDRANTAVLPQVDQSAVAACCSSASSCVALVGIWAEKIRDYDPTRSPSVVRHVTMPTTYSCEGWDPVNNQIVLPNLAPAGGLSYSVNEAAALLDPADKCRYLDVSVIAPNITLGTEYSFAPYDGPNSPMAFKLGLNNANGLEFAVFTENANVTQRLPLNQYGNILLASQQEVATRGACQQFIRTTWALDLAPLRTAIAPNCAVKLAVRRVKVCAYSVTEGESSDYKKYYSDWIFQSTGICPHFTCDTDCSNITTDPSRIDGGRVRGCTLNTSPASPPTSYPTEDTCFTGCGANFKCDSTLRPVYDYVGGSNIPVIVGYAVSGLCWKYAGLPDPGATPPSYADSAGCATHCCSCRDNGNPWQQPLCACSSSSSSSNACGECNWQWQFANFNGGFGWQLTRLNTCASPDCDCDQPAGGPPYPQPPTPWPYYHPVTKTTCAPKISSSSSSFSSMPSSSATPSSSSAPSSSSSSSSSSSNAVSSSSSSEVIGDYFCYKCQNSSCTVAAFATPPAYDDPCWLNNNCCAVYAGLYDNSDCDQVCSPVSTGCAVPPCTVGVPQQLSLAVVLANTEYDGTPCLGFRTTLTIPLMWDEAVSGYIGSGMLSGTLRGNGVQALVTAESGGAWRVQIDTMIECTPSFGTQMLGLVKTMCLNSRWRGVNGPSSSEFWSLTLSGTYAPDSSCSSGSSGSISPDGLNAEIGDGQVTLTWSPPPGVNEADITDYVVQYSSDNGVTWQNA